MKIDKDLAFTFLNVGFGAIVGVVSAKIDFDSAYLAACFVLLTGVVILTITWPFKQTKERNTYQKCPECMGRMIVIPDGKVCCQCGYQEITEVR